MRNVDTMDAKDWIILRLLKLCASAPQTRTSPDFAKTAYWAATNLDVLACGAQSVATVLHETLARERAADLYIYEQWPRPDSIDAIVPFEALLTSVQTNDN